MGAPRRLCVGIRVGFSFQIVWCCLVLAWLLFCGVPCYYICFFGRGVPRYKPLCPKTSSRSLCIGTKQWATHCVGKFPCKTLPRGHGVGMFSQCIDPTQPKQHDSVVSWVKVMATTGMSLGMTVNIFQSVGIIGMMTVDWPGDLRDIFASFQAWMASKICMDGKYMDGWMC